MDERQLPDLESEDLPTVIFTQEATDTYRTAIKSLNEDEEMIRILSNEGFDPKDNFDHILEELDTSIKELIYRIVNHIGSYEDGEKPILAKGDYHLHISFIDYYHYDGTRYLELKATAVPYSLDNSCILPEFISSRKNLSESYMEQIIIYRWKRY